MTRTRIWALLAASVLVAATSGCGSIGPTGQPAATPPCPTSGPAGTPQALVSTPAGSTVSAQAAPVAFTVAADTGDFTVEINQAIGIQQANAQNFVAGKQTVVLAYLKADAKIDEATTSAVVVRDGSTVATLKPKTQEQPVKVVEFLCPDMPACGDWQKGTYQFQVSINGARVTSGNVVFAPSKSVRVLAVNVKAKYGSTITQVKGEQWKQFDSFTRSTYPIAASSLRWTVREEVDATAFDLETQPGQQGLWQQLVDLIPNTCTADPAGAGCYDLVVGFISDRPNGYPNGTLQGYTYGAPATIVVASDNDAQATVAHEIAHLYKVGDTYGGGSINCKVNPAPDGVSGKDWDNRSQTTSCTAGAKQYSPTVSATLISAAAAHPYEVGGRGLLPDMADFMGSGGPQNVYWVTPEVYGTLFKGLAAQPVALSSTRLLAANAASAPMSLLYYFGYVQADGSFVAEPWYTFSSVDSETPPTSANGETVTIRVLDASGQQIASKDDKVNFYPNTSPGAPIVKIGEAALEGVVSFPAGASKVQVAYQGKVIYEKSVSANKPVVTDVTPTQAGQRLDCSTRITWKASDVDGNPLTYTVEFNPDTSNPNSDWSVLADGLTSPEWTEDLSQWPGGAHAAFRVTATDGILSSDATSQEFTVPFKAPEVTIDDPPWGTNYAVGDEIYLSAYVFDMQDDPLPDGSLVWTADQDPTPLGHGSEIVTSLPAGTHTITLTVTNSHGLVTKAVLAKQIVVK